MSEFVERLNELLFESNLSRKEFAQKAGLNATCITHYLQGRRIPTVESLIKIADFFQCSTDFLLGREEDNRRVQYNACPPFSERLEFLQKYFKMPAHRIYRDTDVPKSSYYEWLCGKRTPSLENVIRLADLFDCRVDFVLGREL